MTKARPRYVRFWVDYDDQAIEERLYGPPGKRATYTDDDVLDADDVFDTLGVVQHDGDALVVGTVVG